MIVELSMHFIRDGSHVYDLGCVTGTTPGLLMEAFRGKRVRFVGIDNSRPMLRQAELELREKFPERFSEGVCLP